MKTRVAVLFGGCSDEYDVSLHSAAGVLRCLDAQKYTITKVGITREGDWFITHAGPEDIEQNRWHTPQDQPAILNLSRSHCCLVCPGGQELPVDVWFPVLHGHNGEDGTLQGMLDLFGQRYVGCGRDASLLAMDKGLSHQLASQAGIAVSPFVIADQLTLKEKRAEIEKLKLPCFVKPVSGGSSIGISKITSWDQLDTACAEALTSDSRILIEEAVAGEEIGCSILEWNGQLQLGAVDRIHLASDFFDYEEKYVDSHAQVECPAQLNAETITAMKELAVQLWQLHHCRGLARIDCFLTPAGQIIFNEINTLPGLTATSRYPRMMSRAGLDFTVLLDRLVEQALEGKHAS